MGPDGLLLVHKPGGMTSHDVVQVLRRRLGVRRIGHTGTLDPMAEGLLILLVGAATAHQQRLQGHDKTYEATIRFGVKTDTGDAEGAPVETAPVPALDDARVTRVLQSLTGAVPQIPPAFSAVKVRGKPAYWWARRQAPVVLQPRTIRVHRLELLARDAGSLTISLDCSAGTYVRTLGEAIAAQLGTVGHVSRLIRRRIGRWTLEEAVPLSWCADASPEEIARRLLPIDAPHPSDACLKPAV